MKKLKANKKSIIIVIFGLLLILILALIILYLAPSRERSNSVAKQKGFSGTLSIDSSVKAETDLAKTKTIGPDGTVFWTRGSDGTLYTLTVPPGAIILPSDVTITPLKNVPFKNYSNPSYGNGVLIEGSFSFIRPAYLTIQNNTAEPTNLTNTGVTPWGRCNIGSRGYDPEICAADNKVKFGGGVDPGKVMIMGSTKFDRILLSPTIPTGDDSINAMIFNSGYYLADQINGAQAKDIAEITFEGSNDYTNQTEVLMHLYKMGGNIREYESQIARFEYQKKDYQREITKGAILAKAIGNDRAYQKRMEDLFKERDQLFDNFRGAFVPVTRYMAFMEQFNTDVKSSWFSQKALAYELPDYKPNSSGGQESDSGNASWWDKLRDYNPFDRKEKNPGDDLPDYDPSKEENGDNLPDYPDDNLPSDQNEDQDEDQDEDWGTPTDDPSEDAEDEIRKRDEERRKKEENRLRDIIGSSIYSCSEKYDAIEAIFRIGNLSDSDLDAISKVIVKCMNSCQTMGECEQTGDFGNRTGHSGAIAAANYRIMAFLEAGAQCTDAELMKKGLDTFGKNFCQGGELW